MSILLIALTLMLAFANGANDVSKGIATLVGSGVTRFRAAVAWGTLWTTVGAVSAAFASQGLVAAFSGKGFLLQPTQDPHFLLAVAVGAILWLAFASATGLPVSTTHALTGALFGAGLFAAGPSGLKWAALGEKFALPLLASPVMSLVLTLIVYKGMRKHLTACQGYCVCAQVQPSVRLSLTGGPGAAAVAVVQAEPALRAGPVEGCEESSGTVAGVRLIDGMHWMTSGLTSFARGMNDTPKVLALGAAAAAASGVGGGRLYALVAAAMALGSYIAGMRVTRTLAEKVTRIEPEDGFAANLVTALLVAFASRLALPVSTTHVSTGAIIGVGLSQGGGSLQWKTIRDMMLAWVVTLPVSAVFAWACYAAVSRF